MMRLTLFRKTLRDNRGALIGGSLANVLIALADTLIYPSFRESLAGYQFPEALSGLLGEATVDAYSSFEGFLTVEYFSFLPVLLIILAIVGGTAALVGEEESGTLDLMLAQPVSRHWIVFRKVTALAMVLVVTAFASLPAFLVALTRVDVVVNRWHLILAVINTFPIALFFLALSLFASATMPTRGAAVLIAAGFAIVTYFFNLIGAAASQVQFLQKLSPFYWADASHVLYHGFDWQRTAGFLLLTGALLVLTLVSFQRRDIAVSAREWHARALLARLGSALRVTAR